MKTYEVFLSIALMSGFKDEEKVLIPVSMYRGNDLGKLQDMVTKHIDDIFKMGRKIQRGNK